MKTALRWSIASMVVFALAGCGLKGPLYFPPVTKPGSKNVAAPSASANQANGVSPDKDAAKNSGQLY